MIKRGIQALAALTVVTTSPATAAVVLEEDFESGTFGDFSATGQVQVADGNIYLANCCAVSGNLDNKFAAFGGGDATSGILSLTTAFNATVNQLYSLKFDLGALGNGSESFTFSVNNIPTLFFTAQANNNLNATFTTYYYNFTGNGDTQFSFTSGGVASVDAILDNFVISAVPELEVWAMMLVGFGAIGFQMRRRGGLRAVTA